MNPIILLALAYFSAMLLIAQYLAPRDYSPRRHTISQLASQGYERKRLMQAGFLIYGAMFSAALVEIMLQSTAPLYRDIPHLVYGLALLPTGIYCSMPFLRGLRFSRREARLHGVLAKISGGAFGLGIAVHAVVNQTPDGRIFHAASFAVYMTAAVWFGRTRRNMGAVQRFMYAFGSVWLLFTYGTGVFLAG
ncbi:MAG: DUF998 domain-containing protein [Spirochaetes bacterium]|jgi:hypothetical protein|nr:DUF998 domain-containing protein [Spirochaetota bacterium]